MTVSGHEIIEVCRACYSENGYGVRLKQKEGEDGVLVCPHNPAHKYKVVDGFLEKV